MITARPVTVVALETTNPAHAFALGFEAGAFSQYCDADLIGYHPIWAANATIIELMAMDRGFTVDVVDSCQDKLLIQITRTPE